MGGEEVREAVVNALEGQLQRSLDPTGPGSAARPGGTRTGTLLLVREALLAALDAVCGELPAAERGALLLRLLRTANAALDKASTGGGTGGGSGGGGSKVGADAALMVLSLAAVAVRHLDPDRGGLAMAAIGGRLSGHGDMGVREAVAGALPLLYSRYAAHPGALEQMFEALEPLCADKIWSIRQACARVVSELSRLCSRAGDDDDAEPRTDQGSQEQRAQERERADGLQIRLLRQLYLDTLLPSKSQWVMTAARQQVGAAIASLRRGRPVEQLLPPLLEAYCGAAAAVGQSSTEVRRSVAESFGEVVAKAGPARWPQLQPVFVSLLAAKDATTLCSLVASAERVVRLLAAAAPATAATNGHGATVSGGDACGGGGGELVGLYNAARQVVSGPLLDVLRNQLQLVAPAASTALAGLLRVCPPELQRELLQLLPQLCEPPVGESCGDWRRRLRVASQLHAAARAVAAAAAAGGSAAAGGTDAYTGSGAGGTDSGGVDSDTAGNMSLSVARCAVTLCGDPVWAVRRAAATQVGLMLKDVVPPQPPAEGDRVEPRAEAEDRTEPGVGAAEGSNGGIPGGAVRGGEGAATAATGVGVSAAASDSVAERTDPGEQRAAAAAGAVAAPAVWEGASSAAALASFTVSAASGPEIEGRTEGSQELRGPSLPGLSAQQIAWLDLALGRLPGQCRGKGEGAGRAESGGGGGSEAQVAGGGAAVVELAAWLRRAALQGSRAERDVAAAACRAAVPGC